MGSRGATLARMDAYLQSIKNSGQTIRWRPENEVETGVSQNLVMQRCARNPKFKLDIYAALDANKRAAATQVAKGTIEGSPLEAFLAAFDSDGDRVSAARKAGLEWHEVPDLLDADPAAKLRYERILARRMVEIDDVIYREGKGGNATLAHNYAKSHNPKYRGRGTDDTPEETSSFDVDAWASNKLEVLPN